MCVTYEMGGWFKSFQRVFKKASVSSVPFDEVGGSSATSYTIA